MSLEHLIIVAGAPRSGTSWLGKILDSCPVTDYLHEPDSFLNCTGLPPIVEREAFNSYSTLARMYIQELACSPPVGSLVKPPFFPKEYEGILFLVSKGLRYGIRVAKCVPGIGDTLARVQVPSVFACKNTKRYPVIKTVISLGRIGLYAYSVPEARVVIPVRHPCGFVASEIRGAHLGKMNPNIAIGALSQTSAAKRLGLTLEFMKMSDMLTRFACAWTILHEHALGAIQKYRNVRVVLHDDLAMFPLKAAQDIFEFCGLPWTAQTEEFVITSSSGGSDDDYFSVKRNSVQQVSKWRQELTNDEIHRIEEIVRRGGVYRMLFKNDRGFLT